MAANNRTPSVEFIVKPREDLYLEGSLRKLPRVLKNEPYPCQMQKAQSFSCLFRHYAKHNGLRKEDLVFFFVDELLPDQTPETVHLMAQDEIWVEHRKVDEKAINTHVEESMFSENFRSLLETSDHSDIKFVVGEASEELCAHKAILSARSEYFRVMFKKGVGSMAESALSTITVLDHSSSTFRRMLEYIYSNKVKDLESCDLADVISLLVLANEYCLDRLQYLCEVAASGCLDKENIARTTLLSINYDLEELKQECKSFLSKNVVELRRDSTFRKEVEDSPQLGLFLFDAWPQDDCEQGSSKRRCVGEPSARESVVPVVPSQAPQAEVSSNNVSNW